MPSPHLSKKGRIQNVLLFFIIAAACTLSLLQSCSDDNEVELPVDAQIEGYTLEWFDEFNGNSIDEGSWNFEIGDGRDYGLPAGWGNNELQIYTDEQQNAAIVEDDDLSVLAITALRDETDGYTSSKLTTNGKISVLYGRIDIKAKMPQGQGIWPALWMLGDNRGEVNWPGCGEIDIAEVIGSDPSTYHGTLHYTNGNYGKGEIQGSYSLPSGAFSDDYHVFSTEWTDTQITFSVDDTQIANFSIEEDMLEFRRSFYLIMNVAVGGYWPGYPNESTSFPQSLLVDYVRVYSIDGYNPPAEPPLEIEKETLGGNLPDDLANVAFNDDFKALGDAKVVAYGAGGQPSIYVSDNTINGAQSIAYNFPGGNWGGAWFELAAAASISDYSTIVFSVKIPDELTDAEIKLESPSSAAAVFLINYQSEEIENGFHVY
ncbi:MAG: glycoside hydrolase family 16 protein, partial [Cyclobacteriaceae bacterium]